MGCAAAAVAFTELNVSGDKNLNALKMAITFSGSNIHQIAPGRDGYAAALLHNTTLNCNDKNKPDNVCCCFAQFIQPAFFCFIAMRNSTYPSQPLRKHMLMNLNIFVFHKKNCLSQQIPKH